MDGAIGKVDPEQDARAPKSPRASRHGNRGADRRRRQPLHAEAEAAALRRGAGEAGEVAAHLERLRRYRFISEEQLMHRLGLGRQAVRDAHGPHQAPLARRAGEAGAGWLAPASVIVSGFAWRASRRCAEGRAVFGGAGHPGRRRGRPRACRAPPALPLRGGSVADVDARAAAARRAIPLVRRVACGHRQMVCVAADPIGEPIAASEARRGSPHRACTGRLAALAAVEGPMSHFKPHPQTSVVVFGAAGVVIESHARRGHVHAGPPRRPPLRHRSAGLVTSLPHPAAISQLAATAIDQCERMERVSVSPRYGDDQVVVTQATGTLLPPSQLCEPSGHILMRAYSPPWPAGMV